MELVRMELVRMELVRTYLGADVRHARPYTRATLKYVGTCLGTSVPV